MTTSYEEVPISVYRMSSEEFEMFYRGGGPDPVEAENKVELESDLDRSNSLQREDLTIQYCRGDSLIECKEIIVSRIDYEKSIVPWKCHIHASQGTSSSDTATCDRNTFPCPQEGKGNPLHWSDMLLSPDATNRKENTALPRLTLYDPSFVVPKSILNNDMPGTIYVYSIKTPAEYPRKHVYYYKIGNFIDLKAAGLAHLNHCSKFRELRFKKHYPNVTRLHSYSTNRFHTLTYQIYGNLAKNGFEVLGTKKSTTCMGCHGSHMEWYSITKEKGDSLKSAKEPSLLYPGWHFVHVLIMQLLSILHEDSSTLDI